MRDASPGPWSPRACWDHLPRQLTSLGSTIKRIRVDTHPRHAPRDSLRVFQKLSEIFSDENNYSLSRELLIKVRGWASFSALCGNFQACLLWTLGREGSVCSMVWWPQERDGVCRLSQKGRVSWQGQVLLLCCPLPWHPASSGLVVAGVRGRHPFLHRPAQGWHCRAWPGARPQRGCPGRQVWVHVGWGAKGESSLTLSSTLAGGHLQVCHPGDESQEGPEAAEGDGEQPEAQERQGLASCEP